MRYSNIINDMTWSYTRVTCFEDCRYKFLLTYIFGGKKKPMFFSGYGTLMHKIIEMYLNNEIEEHELVTYFLSNYKKCVAGKAPNGTIFKSYLDQGIKYLSNIDFKYKDVLSVEKGVSFFVGDRPFVGIIDCVAKDGDDIIIVDNKSRTLSPRSARKKPTKSDVELSQYLRQLYLYSIPVAEQYGKQPSRLEFNCFRNGNWISEQFDLMKLEETKEWLLNTIDVIVDNDDWHPNIDYWRCRYLCDYSDQCEYFQLNRGGQ